MGLSKTIKKIGKAVNPLVTAPFQALGKSLNPKVNVPVGDPFGDMSQFEAMAALEEQKRKDLGLQQQGQINTFADNEAKRAAEYRANLAKSLADTSAQTFQRLNPSILEDLNSRGLFTSQTARDTSQAEVLGDLAREQSDKLLDFDTDVYNRINDIRGSGLEAVLGGDQSALDAALALKKAGLTRSFDVADANRERSFSEALSKRQGRQQLFGSLIGAGGSIIGGSMGRR